MDFDMYICYKYIVDAFIVWAKKKYKHMKLPTYDIHSFRSVDRCLLGSWLYRFGIYLKRKKMLFEEIDYYPMLHAH